MTLLALVPAPSSRPALQGLAPPPCFAPQSPLPLAGEGALRALGPPDVDEQTMLRVTALTRAVCEALAGRRPLVQVRPLVSVRVWQLLEHLARARAGDGLSAASLRVQLPTEDVAEAAVRLAGGGRSAAVALRLECRRATWRVSLLECALVPDARRPARS